MPLYAYRCPACGRTEEVIRPMSESGDTLSCSCGEQMDRDMAAENGAVPVGCENAEVFWSDSLAISPEQVAEHRKKFPDVLIDAECRPGFTSHKQREKYLEACGFVKQPAKLKR